MLGGRAKLPIVEEYPTPLVRERQLVAIGNTTETWELRWKAPPRPACGTSDGPPTCPCIGFGYGEGGDLLLTRIQNGREIDSLDLTPVFKSADVNRGMAILQRWEPDYQTDFKASERQDFPEVVARRPVVKIMEFTDYDRDGQRSEFFLQTGTLPCGKQTGVVVGVSKSDRKLHFFGTATNPTEPLVLQKPIWDALSHAKGSVEVVDWHCDDHGSDQEIIVRVKNTNRGVEGVRRMFSCPRGPKQRPTAEESL